jgi:hypothetical protein
MYWRMRWVFSTHGEKNKAYVISVRKPEGRTPLRRPVRRWQDNIKKDLRGMKGGGMDLIYVSQDSDQC